VAIAPTGIAVAIETKTRTYDARHLDRVREQAGWLSRSRRRWVDVDWPDASLSLGVADLETGFRETDVLVVKRAQLADPWSGEGESGEDRAAWSAYGCVRFIGAPVEVDRGPVPHADVGGDRPPLEPLLVAEMSHLRRFVECRRRVSAVELVGGLEQREEFVDIERAAVSAALQRLAGSSAARNVAVDPAGILGLVEDLRERDERLVNRFVGQRP
jgi:hypothetical protein